LAAGKKKTNEVAQGMRSVPMPIVIEHDPTLVKLFVHGVLLVHPIRSSIQFGPYSCPLSKGKRES